MTLNPNWRTDLIPIKKGQTDIPRLGGQTMTERKHQTLWITASRHAKCMNCSDKLECPFKKYNLEMDAECRCSIPEMRGRACMMDMTIWTEEVIEKCSRENLKELKNRCSETKDFKMYHDMLMDVWNKLFPTVQKNLNLNVEVKNVAKEWAREILEEAECEDAEYVDVKLDGGGDTVIIAEEEGEESPPQHADQPAT